MYSIYLALKHWIEPKDWFKFELRFNFIDTVADQSTVKNYIFEHF